MRIITIIAFCLLTTAAFGTEEATPRPVDPALSAVPEAGEIQLDGTETAIPALSEHRLVMLEELRQLRENTKAQVAELAVQLDDTPDFQERLEIQRRVEEIKNDAILQDLIIQRNYAERGGFTDLFRRLDTDIQLFEARRDAPRRAVPTGESLNRQNTGGR